MPTAAFLDIESYLFDRHEAGLEAEAIAAARGGVNL